MYENETELAARCSGGSGRAEDVGNDDNDDGDDGDGHVARSNEYRIKRSVLRGYDRTSRPVVDDRTTISVSVNIVLNMLETVRRPHRTVVC